MSRPDLARPGVRAAIWLPGLLVALGAAVATAHGLFEVASAAGAPGVIAGLYPLITDGLALVAYAATTQLTGTGRRYAWTVVILAAGLSGLAQAAYLAGGVAAASTVLRFGVGAWPALAAAVAAHLLFLISTVRPSASVQPDHASDVQPDLGDQVQARRLEARTRRAAVPTERLNGSGSTAKARERALNAALQHASEAGRWPTVSALETLAAVSRGTAATALQQLRNQGPPNPPPTVTGESSAES